MKIITNVLTVVAVASLASLAIGRMDVVGRFLRFNCVVYEPSIIQNVSCWVKSFNWTYALANMRGNILQPLTKVKIHVQMYRKYQLSYRLFLINVTEDYCAFFANNRAGTFFRVIWPMYKAYTNMNHTCPYYGDAILKDLPLTSEMIPPVWPPDIYRLSITCYEEKQKLFMMEFYVEIKEKPRPKQSILP